MAEYRNLERWLPDLPLRRRRGCRPRSGISLRGQSRPDCCAGKSVQLDPSTGSPVHQLLLYLQDVNVLGVAPQPIYDQVS